MGTNKRDVAAQPATNRITEWRTARDITLDVLAERAGISKSYLSRLISGERNLSVKNLKKISTALEVPIADLLPTETAGLSPENLAVISDIQRATSIMAERSHRKVQEELLDHMEQEEQNKTGRSLPPSNAELGAELSYSRELLPIYGEAAGGNDGRFLMNGEVIERVPRPGNLVNVVGAYGAYVRGDSMLPRYEDGDVVHVNPNKPYRAGKYVLAQITVDGDPIPRGFIKKFVSLNSRELVLEQLNPPEGEDRIMRFDRETVETIHRIVGAAND